MKSFFNKKNAFLLATLIAAFFLTPEIARAASALEMAAGLFADVGSFLTSIIGWTFEIAILPTAAAMMALVGLLMDMAINFGLHTGYIFAFSPAVNLGWVIVRDIANIFFIFILIYISLGTLIKGTGFGTKQLLTQLIIAAILVNFSMFFTKAIIDVSNIFGNWLYGGIQKTLVVNSAPTNMIGEKSGPVSLSALIADRLGILKFWVSGQTKDQLALLDTEKGITSGLIRLILILTATYTFGYVTILFLARSVELLILLVFAPIGFVGKLLPQTEKYAKEWWHELGKVAIFPVAFLLMLYIALQFINGFGLLEKNNVDFGATVETEIGGFDIMTYFQYFIIIFLLNACLKVAKDNAGTVGDMAGGLAKGLGKLAVNGAVTLGSGGAALALRTGAAAAFAARAADKGDALKDAKKAMFSTLRSSNPLPLIGRNAKPVRETVKGILQDGSYDMRNLPLGGKTNIGSILSDATGVDVKGKTAKEIEKDRETFEKEYKLEQNIESILKDIRTLEENKGKTDAAARKALDDAEKGLKTKTGKMSNKDLEAATLRIHSEIKNDAKKDPEETARRMEHFTDKLKQNQVSAILSGEAPGPVKSTIRSARQADFKRAMGDEEKGMAGDPTKIEAALLKLGNEEVAKLDIDDLSKPEVMKHLKSGHLAKIMDEYTYSQRTKIRDYMDKERPADNSVQKWLNSPAGSQF